MIRDEIGGLVKEGGIPPQVALLAILIVGIILCVAFFTDKE